LGEAGGITDDLVIHEQDKGIWTISSFSSLQESQAFPVNKILVIPTFYFASRSKRRANFDCRANFHATNPKKKETAILLCN
jgi:hypothetical protein